MASTVERQVRIQIELSDFSVPGVTILGGDPKYPSGAAMRWDFLFTMLGQVVQISSSSTVQMIVMASTRTGSAYYESSAVSTFDNTTTFQNWIAGTNQHFTIRTLGTDLALSATSSGTEYFMLLTGTVYEGATGYTPTDFGWCRLFALATNWPISTPVLNPGNIIPGGATYSSGGSYTLTGLTVGQYYDWVQGNNDTNLVNGSQTVTVSGTAFPAQGTSATLNGTDNDLVTANVFPAQTLTANQIAALVASLIGSIGGLYRGTTTVASGVESVAINISGLSLGGAPTAICPFFIKGASSNDNLFAVLDPGWTASSFTVQLSGVTTASNNQVGYIIVV